MFAKLDLGRDLEPERAVELDVRCAGGLEVSDATDGPVLRWYRHRGYLLARPGESCYIDTPAGTAGLNAGPSTSPWRLAVTTPGRTGRRQQHGNDGFSVSTT